jgi:predicted ATPase/transcriptional regulator with XRE-family HTH domain
LAEVSFGEWLKRRRKAGGLTQEQLAQQVSCSTITLRKIEAEERRPSVQIVERLAEIFNIPQNEQPAFLRFARGDWKSAPAIESEDAPWRALGIGSRSRLPSRLNALIGREQDVAQVRQYLTGEGTRLVTLTGPPGIGKTSLSQQVAVDSMQDFDNGVFFVALAGLNDPDLVASTIGQTLRFEGRGRVSTLELLQDSIADKQMLLVLDNFEHILEAAPILPVLLTACPNLKILVTSREALRVPGEWLHSVPPLVVPQTSRSKEFNLTTAHRFSALTLFAERARAVRSDFNLNPENVEIVAAICSRLDGLPLAIELIAARVRLMSPQELFSRMDNRFTLYADGMRAVPQRQKTLYNAIAWSYELLTPKEQRLFTHLAVFVGGFTLASAAQITEDPDLLNSIASLLDKSLLQQTPAEHGETRFTMLFTIREFALNQLNQMGEMAKVRDQHLNFFVHFAEQAEIKFFTSDQAGWFSQMGTEIDNLRSAMEWSMKADTTMTSDSESPRLQAGLRLAGALYWIWDDRDFPDETSRWVKTILSKAKQPTAARARALLSLGVLLSTVNNFLEARPYSEEALAICRQLNDPLLLAWALTYRGAIDEAEMDYGSAQAYIQQSLEIAENLKIGPLVGWNLTLLADTFYMQENLTRAKELYEKSAILMKEIRQRDLLAYPLRRLGYLAMHEGDIKMAAQRFKDSLELNWKTLFQYGIMASLTAFARLAITEQKMARAAQLFGFLDSRFKAASYRLYLIDEVEYDRGLTELDLHLNNKNLDEAWTKGRGMLIEEAITFALEENL